MLFTTKVHVGILLFTFANLYVLKYLDTRCKRIQFCVLLFAVYRQIGKRPLGSFLEQTYSTPGQFPVHVHTCM